MNDKSDKAKYMSVYEEFRLIEQDEASINRAWKGAHLLLFFLAFVFGSFCTFCFHMLMYLFDEKCVLFPKLLSLTSLRHNVIYEFIPTNSDLSNLPVDFLSTQWVEKSTCALPTYVPLVSGIFGLVWTTLFLMCSTGDRTLTGLQRPWRVLPPVFIFSLLMGGLCVYSSAITHYGLEELCIKLGEITGSSTCTYTVNVATLTYERRIRGVYQATRLTILSAWLHTACWLCSALLAVLRVLLVVDFRLVRVSVKIRGDVDKMMEQNESQIRIILPDTYYYEYASEMGVIVKDTPKDGITEILSKPSETLFGGLSAYSEQTLPPNESHKLSRRATFKRFPRDKQFIAKMVYDLLENVCSKEHLSANIISGNSSSAICEDIETKVVRQHGIDKKVLESDFIRSPDLDKEDSELKDLKQFLDRAINENQNEIKELETNSNFSRKKRARKDSSNKRIIEIFNKDRRSDELLQMQAGNSDYDSKTIVPSTFAQKKTKKSNIKTVSTQTEVKPLRAPKHVNIESKSIEDKQLITKKSDTQTQEKEKQD